MEKDTFQFNRRIIDIMKHKTVSLYSIDYINVEHKPPNPQGATNYTNTSITDTPKGQNKYQKITLATPPGVGASLILIFFYNIIQFHYKI